MNIEHIQAMLAERVRTGLAEAKAKAETVRLRLYGHQSTYTSAIHAMPAIKAYEKRLRTKLTQLGKDFGFRGLELYGRVNQSNYNHPPCPPHIYNLVEERIRSLHESVNYEVKTHEQEGGKLLFDKHIYVPFTGKIKDSLLAWEEDFNLYKEHDARAGRLNGMNVANESQILHLKLTEPGVARTLESAIAELLK